MSKSKEALALLDDLDSLSVASAPPPPATTSSHRVKKSGGGLTSTPRPATPPVNVNDKDAADALAFLDEISQKAAEPRKSMQPLPGATTRVTLGGGSRPGTPSLRKSADIPRNSPRPSEPTSSFPTQQASSTTPANVGGGWGWGSVWNTASAAIATAKEKVDEQVKNLPPMPQMPPVPQTEQARKWGEGMMSYVKQAQLAQDLRTTSLSTLTGLMNVVAPPIAEHEVIQITLSHDMVGYDGIETLVYRAMARVLEQVEGGDIVVNHGQESRAKDRSGDKRDLNPVEGLVAALKLSEVDIDEQIKTHAAQPPKEPHSTNPTTYTPVFLRVQPFTSTFPPLSDPTDATGVKAASKPTLQFFLYLTDPEHRITRTTVSNVIPYSWITLWDLDNEDENRKNGEWIEDMLVEALRIAVEMIGQEYIVARMSWDAPLEENVEADEKGKAKEEQTDGA